MPVFCWRPPTTATTAAGIGELREEAHDSLDAAELLEQRADVQPEGQAPRATMLAAPLHELDFPDDYFDVIACGPALLALPTPALIAALSNLRRMLKPGAPLLGAVDGEQLARLAPALGLFIEDMVPCGAVVKAEALFRARKA